MMGGVGGALLAIAGFKSRGDRGVEPSVEDRESKAGLRPGAAVGLLVSVRSHTGKGDRALTYRFPVS